jgi:hypothetical protein
MFSLFLLLFKKSYWKMLLRRASWYEAWLSLKRVHKDKRARSHLRRFALMLLAPFLCLTYLVWLVGSGGLVVVPIIAALIWWRGRRTTEDGKLPSILPPSETGPADRVLNDQERNALRNYFAEFTLVCAVMVARAGSESYLKEKELPENLEVTSRRSYIDLLKSRNLWDRIANSDRDAMLAPDGHWDPALIQQVALGLEAVRLLRWMLRIDYYLPLVGQQLKSDYAQAYELVSAPQKLFEGNQLTLLPTVRVGRDSANVFYQRCIAEAINRGYYEAADADAAEWAKRVSGALSGQQHEDFVLGGSLVSEATQNDLLWATSISRRRRDFLAWALTVMQSASVPDAPFPSLAGN